MSLRELQLDLQRDLLGATGTISAAIVEAPPLSVEARLGIYRHAYRARLTEALDEVYPVLHKILGDETFESMAELFIETHRSTHRSIRWYGREVGDFLAEVPPFAEQPALSEIARFEWSLSEAFDAADATPIDRSALGTHDPQAWPSLTFRFHPSLRRLTFSWNTVAIWQSMSDDADPPAPQAGAAVPWALWRQGFKNYFRSLDAAEEAALDAASDGCTFAEMCARLEAFLPADEIPQRAAVLLAGWLDSGLIVGLE
jgi:hypothetical protein